MLTCIARSKKPSDDHPPPEKPNSNAAAPTKQSIKSISSQIKGMALKASGAYRNCAPCANPPAAQGRSNGSSGGGDLDQVITKDKFIWSYRRTVSLSSNSSSSTAGRKELQARLKGISSGEATASGRRVDPVVFVEESEPKEWVAQVEPGVLITFVSLPRGGNDLKQIKFSREMFNKWQAQRWWAENCEKLKELYNVQRLNRQAFPLPSPPRSEDSNNNNISSSKFESLKDSPVTPPLGGEPPPRALHRPNGPTTEMGYSASGSLDHHHQPVQSRCNYEYSATPKLSSNSGTYKTETSSVGTTTSSSRDTEEISSSNGSCLETEWVEQDEPGVYITIRALHNGRRELRRVRFREMFGEMHARVWWEENRARIHKEYL